jgi:diguanylate cyclase (GGDEF)-like protein/PAS domain S-box-containing protein
MRLPDFIRSSSESILDQWTLFAQAMPHAHALDNLALRDHARRILYAIATDLEEAPCDQPGQPQGRAPHPLIVTEAELHGVARFSEGFDVNDAMAEFRALRASVLRLWEAQLPLPQAEAIDINRFNEAVDQAVAESLARFTEMKERRSRLFDALLLSSPDLNYIVSTTGTLIYANKAFADVFQKTPGELAGVDFFALCAPFEPSISLHLRDVVAGGRSYRGEMDAMLPGAGPRSYEYLLVPVLNPSGQCEAVAGSARDITERKESEEQILRRANHDSLTGLPNRSLFRERLEHEIKHAARTGLPLALLFIDLDGFKEVNDRLGHAAGDQLLQEVARRINSCVRDTDTVARLGGDEFTVILTDVTRPAHIQAIAGEIRDEVHKPFALAAGEAGISCSIGITLFPGDGALPDLLVRNADEAMYQSKKAGGNRYQFFTTAMRSPA